MANLMIKKRSTTFGVRNYNFLFGYGLLGWVFDIGPNKETKIKRTPSSIHENKVH